MLKRQPDDRSVLLVDDEPSWLMTLEVLLSRNTEVGEVVSLSDSRQVMETLARQEFALVLLDYSMPGLSGETLLQMISRDYPDLPVMVLTGHNQVDTAVACMRAGASDYFIKSQEEDRLVAAVRRVLAWQAQKRENERLKKGLLGGRLEQPQAFADLVCQSPSMAAVCHFIEAIAAGRDAVLIEGEGGTGKKLLAQALHRASGVTGELVTQNLDGLDDTQFALALFGHAAGAVPSLTNASAGLIEQSAGGTLLLEGIDSLNEDCQLQLLRVLQDGQFKPVGAEKPRRVHSRFVFTSRRNLLRLVEDGSFRRDLNHRLQAYHLQVPPLRERTEDIAPLLDLFLRQAAQQYSKRIPTPPRELLILLRSYHFPDNVAELRDMVFNAVSRHSSHKLSMETFRTAMGRVDGEVRARGAQTDEAVIFGEELPTIRSLMQQLVLEAMERAQGNQTVMADMLGISRPALNKRLKNLREEGVID